mgnify:CR=1 FL=1|tara:strand:+ start:80 stop:571 length:492 start_codon:yes stop_codon:yes gene_type:complete
MAVEIMAAIAAANSAFKMLTATAKKINSARSDIDSINTSIGRTLDKFWDARDAISAHEKRNKTPSRFERTFRSNELEESASEIVFHRDSLAQKEKDLKELLIYSGRGDLYDELKRERRRIKQEKARRAVQAAKDRAFFIDCCFIAGIFVFFSIVIYFVVRMII